LNRVTRNTRTELRAGFLSRHRHPMAGLAGEKIKCLVGRGEETETNFQSTFIHEVICFVVQILVGPGENDVSPRDLVFCFVSLNELLALLLPIVLGDLDGFAGVQALQEERLEFLLGSAFLVFAKQLTDVFAGSAVGSLLDSFFHEVLKRLRERYVK